MSLEKAIQKLTNAVTKRNINTAPLAEPSGPIGLPPKRVTCKTESVGNDSNGFPLRDPKTGFPMVKCVCRHGKDCIVQTMDGPCQLEGFVTTVPFETPCQ